MHILWVRSKIKIFEKENIQDIFHDKLSFLLGKKITGTKIEFLRIVIMYFVDIFIIRRLLGTRSTISQR